MINRLKLEKYSALYLWAVFMILFWFWRPDSFMTTTSFRLVSQENVVIGVLALAFLVPLTTATYDLAIGHYALMALVITNWIAKNTELPQATGIALGLGACLLGGIISGFVVVRLKVDSLLATLGMSQGIFAFGLDNAEAGILEVEIGSGLAGVGEILDHAVHPGELVVEGELGLREGIS